MTVASTAVAIGFGLLVGWGLRSRDFARTPVLVAPAIGLATGAAVLVFSLGSDPELAGGSLILGCTGILAVLLVRRRSGDSASTGERPSGGSDDRSGP